MQRGGALTPAGSSDLRPAPEPPQPRDRPWDCPRDQSRAALCPGIHPGISPESLLPPGLTHGTALSHLLSPGSILELSMEPPPPLDWTREWPQSCHLPLGSTLELSTEPPPAPRTASEPSPVLRIHPGIVHGAFSCPQDQSWSHLLP
ncbi:hypothetical protein DUI87_31546 [Hirundo rustica rustica]|uniref:Uncharacterized protein n=1 Tax=Hirundo rustica rustica TaxID=333673 RepID=A0A3M0IT21_HIRRU|nr:hypothetical protein DUI87_31546 [Hirundo rustica rustica]